MASGAGSQELNPARIIPFVVQPLPEGAWGPADGKITVPAGVPVTFVLRNDDPIDHEWIVATEEVHGRHRTSTELVHGAIPTEIPVDAGTVRTTTVTFDEPGTMRYICHLPGHEAYGMVGDITIVGG